MHKFTKNFHTRSTFIATFVRNTKRFTKLVRLAVCMRSYFTTPRVMLARTVKLKRGVILNPEFHYIDEDEISTE